MAGKGRPGPLTKEQSVQRRADIWHAMVHENLTQAQAAERFGISQGRVSQILNEAAGEITQATSEATRKAQLDRLAQRRQLVQEIIDRRRGMEDDPTVLAAIDKLDRMDRREAALTGADAPVEQVLRTYDYRVNGVDTEALK